MRHHHRDAATATIWVAAEAATPVPPLPCHSLSSDLPWAVQRWCICDQLQRALQASQPRRLCCHTFIDRPLKVAGRQRRAAAPAAQKHQLQQQGKGWHVRSNLRKPAVVGLLAATPGGV